MKKNRYSQFLNSGLIVLTLLMSFGCKKEMDSSSVDGTAQLLFNVSGVNTLAANNGNNKLSISKVASAQPSSNYMNLSDQVGVMYSAHEVYNDIPLANSSSASKINGKMAALTTSPVDNGIKYRILVYNNDTGVLVNVVDATVGVTASVSVEAGVNYMWYAYSYNATDGLLPLVFNGGDPILDVLPNNEILWAQSASPVTATALPIDLTINFMHKVAELAIEIKTDNLYGALEEITATFDEDYFYAGILNIKTGTLTRSTSAFDSPVLTIGDFKAVSSADSTTYRAYIYTAHETPLTNIKLIIKSLKIKMDNGESKVLLTTSQTPKEIVFNFQTPAIDKSHVASVDLRYTIATKKILHVTGKGNNDYEKFAFAAQPTTTGGRPPYMMLKEERNFGTASNSIVTTGGFTHMTVLDEVIKVAGASLVRDALVSFQPDIVIITLYYTMTNDDITALSNYLNKGGVVIMFVDNATNNAGELASRQLFINTVFGTGTAINLVQSPHYGAGSLFRMNHESAINDRIINGPFGNLSGQFWGQDTHAALIAEGLPVGSGPNQATVYSDPKAANVDQQPTGHVMFKHNTKNLFWIGNSSFLSTSAGRTVGGWTNGDLREPFATVDLSLSQFNTENLDRNYTYYPMPKRYGYTAFGVGYNATPESMVYNAPLFANLMAWALYQSEFFGIRNNIPADITDWNVVEDSFNVNISNNL